MFVTSPRPVLGGLGRFDRLSVLGQRGLYTWDDNYGRGWDDMVSGRNDQPSHPL